MECGPPKNAGPGVSWVDGLPPRVRLAGTAKAAPASLPERSGVRRYLTWMEPIIQGWRAQK